MNKESVSFITFHFSYCSLVWMLHKRHLNNCIDHIHELSRAYQDYNSFFKELLRKRQLVNINVLIKCQKQKSFRILWKILLTREAATGNFPLGRLFLEISQNPQENTFVRVSFLIKLQATVCNFIKNKTLAQVLFCEFCEISNNTFFTEYLWLLLYWYVTDYMLFERLKNTFKNCSLYTIPITLFYSNLELHSPTKSLLLDVPHKYKKALCSIRIFNFFLMFLLRHHISKLNSIIKPQRRKCFF